LIETQVVEEKGIDVTRFKLAGIVWRQDGYFALVEAPDGLGHILRVNDSVGPDARVKEITKDAVLIEVKNRDVLGRGKVQTIRLELKKEGQ
jgi:Tfp pilus assembly protein PilP